MSDTNDKKLEEFMKKQDAKGMQQVQDLLKSKGINNEKTKGQLFGSAPSILTAISSGTITQNDFANLIQKGGDEFYKETGRQMTCGEMREMYG
jgi:hypothetical protein